RRQLQECGWRKFRILTERKPPGAMLLQSLCSEELSCSEIRSGPASEINIQRNYMFPLQSISLCKHLDSQPSTCENQDIAETSLIFLNDVTYTRIMGQYKLFNIPRREQ